MAGSETYDTGDRRYTPDKYGPTGTTPRRAGTYRPSMRGDYAFAFDDEDDPGDAATVASGGAQGAASSATAEAAFPARPSQPARPAHPATHSSPRSGVVTGSEGGSRASASATAVSSTSVVGSRLRDDRRSAREATPAGKQPQERRRRRSATSVLSTLLIILGVGLLAVAGVMWGMAQWRYHEQAVINERLAQYAEVSDSPNQAPQVDWAGLKAINDEVVAWLQIPGTTINYPVYQGSDNVRYLRHNAEGEWTVGGQLFMDYEGTAPGLVDEQTIVYGHHLDDGSMFEQVAALDNQEAFDATDTVWYVTEQNAWELEPLLMYFTQAEDTNARRFTFASVSDFHAYLTDLLDRSVTRRDDAARIIAGTKHVLTLSTCNYYDGYGRSLLVCVPKSEAREALAGNVVTDDEPAASAVVDGAVEEAEATDMAAEG